MPPKGTTPFGEKAPSGRRPDDTHWVPYKGWHWDAGQKKAGQLHKSSAEKLAKYLANGTPQGSRANSEDEEDSSSDDDEEEDPPEESQFGREATENSSFAAQSDDEFGNAKGDLSSVPERNDEDDDANPNNTTVKTRKSLEPIEGGGGDDEWDAVAAAKEEAKAKEKEEMLLKLAMLKEQEAKLLGQLEDENSAPPARTTRQQEDALRKEEQLRREQAVKDRHMAVRLFLLFCFLNHYLILNKFHPQFVRELEVQAMATVDDSAILARLYNQSKVIASKCDTTNSALKMGFGAGYLILNNPNDPMAVNLNGSVVHLPLASKDYEVVNVFSGKVMDVRHTANDAVSVESAWKRVIENADFILKAPTISATGGFNIVKEVGKLKKWSQEHWTKKDGSKYSEMEMLKDSDNELTDKILKTSYFFAPSDFEVEGMDPTWVKWKKDIYARTRRDLCLKFVDTEFQKRYIGVPTPGQKVVPRLVVVQKREVTTSSSSSSSAAPPAQPAAAPGTATKKKAVEVPTAEPPSKVGKKA